MASHVEKRARSSHLHFVFDVHALDLSLCIASEARCDAAVQTGSLETGRVQEKLCQISFRPIFELSSSLFFQTKIQ